MLPLVRILRILFVLIGALVVIVTACFASPAESVSTAESGWKTWLSDNGCNHGQRVLEGETFKKECKENIR